MLVLTRKKNERILIGGEISITVVEVRGDRVRLGIDAPEDVRIMRSELPPEAQDRLRPQPKRPDDQESA